MLGTEPTTDVGLRLQEIVESVPAGTPPQQFAPWARQVASLGTEAVPEIFRLLRAGAPAEGTGELLSQGLELLDSRRVVACLQDLLPAEAELSAGDAETALHILRRIGRDRDLDWTVQLALRPGHPGQIEEAEVLSLEQAVTAILARDPQAVDELARIARRQGKPVVLPLARALATQDSSSALDGLVSLVKDGVGDLAVVPLVAGLGERRPWFVTDQHRSVIRGGLWESDFQLLREAVQAVARLDDEEALPRLLELVHEQEDVLGTIVNQALRKLTDQNFPELPARWQVWYQEEERWWMEEWPRLFADLESAQVRLVLASLNRLEGRDLHRHAIARPVARLLQHPGRAVRERACAVLATLRCAESAPPLVGALADPDREVVAAASAALETLTGLTAGSAQDEWSRALR